MKFFQKLFGTRDVVPTSGGSQEVGPQEHAVLIHLCYIADEAGFSTDPGFGSRCGELEDRLHEHLSGNPVGECDGNEFGDGRCRVYLYGPNADRLWDEVEPIVRETVWPQGSHAVKRYGEPGDDTPWERVDFA